MLRRKFLFVDVDHTLCSVEGVEQIARARGDGALLQQIEHLTGLAMNGDLSVESVYRRRIELIQPTRDEIDRLARDYAGKFLMPSARDTVRGLLSPSSSASSALRAPRCDDDGNGGDDDGGWHITLLTGGCQQAMAHLVDELGVSGAVGVPWSFDEHDGVCRGGYDASAPTARSGGKPAAIRAMMAAHAQTRSARSAGGDEGDSRGSGGAVFTCMIGDGATDAEARSVTDAFVAFTGVVARPGVIARADAVAASWAEVGPIVEALAAKHFAGPTG